MIRWWRRRPLGEYVVFASSLMAMTVVRPAIRWLPLRTVRRVLWFALASPSLRMERRLALRRVVRCTIAAGTLSLFGTTCLVSALVAQALLHRHGYVADLKIGVQRNGTGGFAAHAWLEYNGQVILGGPQEVVQRYQPMPELEHLIV